MFLFYKIFLKYALKYLKKSAQKVLKLLYAQLLCSKMHILLDIQNGVLYTVHWEICVIF